MCKPLKSELYGIAHAARPGAHAGDERLPKRMAEDGWRGPRTTTQQASGIVGVCAALGRARAAREMEHAYDIFDHYTFYTIHDLNPRSAAALR